MGWGNGGRWHRVEGGKKFPSELLIPVDPRTSRSFLLLLDLSLLAHPFSPALGADRGASICPHSTSAAENFPVLQGKWSPVYSFFHLMKCKSC